MWVQTSKYWQNCDSRFNNKLWCWDEHLTCWKIKNVREHNFEGAQATANWIRILTELSNLNSKVEYLSLALQLNILFLLLVFIGFNTCKVRFGISYTITIIVQAIVNTLGDCGLQEKVVNMTNVHEHNDVTVSIKVQKFRSRCATSVYYNRTLIVCECHGV